MAGAPKEAPRRARRKAFEVLGPGLVAGASDDDPSGIATYAQAGAQFGFGLTWALLLTYPLMCAVQSISARIGRTTGLGIAANLRRRYPVPLVHGIVLLVVAANIINLGADLGAMAESASLLGVTTPRWMGIVFFAVVCLSAQVFFDFGRYVSALKWLTLSLLSYFAALAAVHVEWGALARSLVLPHVELSKPFWTMAVAVLGTTISPYLFFWQAVLEAEQTREDPELAPLRDRSSDSDDELGRINIDTLVGMALSNLVALAIMVTAASTLHAANVARIDTAAQAAEALRPIAGQFAFVVFAVGIVGTGLLSVPVLASSAAYALGETRRWPVGVSKKVPQAKGFYATIAAATGIGALLNVLPVPPMQALVWAAVLNGIVSAPVMAMLVMLATDHGVMGRYRISTRLAVGGWAATGLMGAASVGLLLSTLGVL
jgi:NRAMP (natural resistance-associated macrophage protein)-like metal ion transporter